MPTRWQRWLRRIRAEWRDTRVILRESRLSLLLFLLIILGGATFLFFFYIPPEPAPPLTFSQALHATFALIFFEIVLPYPKEWYVQLLYFIIPVVGLAAVADGIVRFGTALLNKQARGQKWQVAMASTFRNHVIICGMGKVGFRTAQELLKFGREVVGIELDEGGRFVENAKALGIPIIIADARRSDNLLKAGVKVADAIIPATHDELTNLDIALDAREINPNIKVVLRLFDPDLARRVERGFGIHTAISTSALAAPMFAAAAMRVKTQYSFYVGDQLLNVSEFVIESGSVLAGWAIEKLEAELELSVVAYQHGAETDIHPHPHHVLQPGDKILVLASVPVLQQLQTLLKPTMIY